ncbi:uncharacterized protein CCOS01_14773, partial [Colletotrichum costaricense]
QAPEPPSLPLPYHTTGLRSALPCSGQPGARWGSPPAVQPLPRCPAPLRGHEYWIMRLRECGKETTRCRLQNELTAWHSIPHLPLSLFNLIEIILHVPLSDYPQSTSSSVLRRNVCTQVSSIRHPLLCPTDSSFHLPQDLRCVSAVPAQPSQPAAALGTLDSASLGKAMSGLSPRHKCQVFSDERRPRKLTFARPQRGTHQA